MRADNEGGGWYIKRIGRNFSRVKPAWCTRRFDTERPVHSEKYFPLWQISFDLRRLSTGNDE